MPRIVSRTLYQRTNPDGPKRVTYEETVYGPDEDFGRGLGHWRECEEPGEWVLLDDGGAARVLRLSKYGNLGTYVVTAGGDGRIEKPKDQILSTGSPTLTDRISYGKFIEVDGREVPEKIHSFVDWMLKTGDPVLAVRLSHPRRQRWIAEEDKFPAQIAKAHARDRSKVLQLISREDTRWLVAKSLRKSLEAEGVDFGMVARTLKNLMSDSSMPAETRRKAALDLLEMLKLDDEPGAKGGKGTADVPMAGDRSKIAMIRKGRDKLRKKPGDAKEA